MTIHLVQLMPDTGKFLRWAAERGFMPTSDIGYGLHAILGACFGEQVPSCFVYLDSYRGYRQAHVLGYSRWSAQEMAAAAAMFGEPLAMEALGVSTISSKPMPIVEAGTKLGIEVVTVPVVRSAREVDGKRKQTEHDPYLLAKLRAQGSGPAIDRDAVYREWMEGRLAELGLDVDSLTTVGRRQVSLARRDRSDGENGSRLVSVNGQEVRYDGVIEVVDAETFNSKLARGVGRHRAFGYGMLLFRPPARTALAA